MPPKARANGDDAHGHKADAHKDKNGANGTAAGNAHDRQHATTNGKARRTAATTASATAAAAAAVATAAAATAVNTDQTLQWHDFDRGVLHAYQRAYKIDTPGAFSNEFSRWILSQPGSVGLKSPTALRLKAMRRQSKTQLANVTRKHFNGLGVQENDIVVDFLHKVQTREVVRLRRPRRHGSNSREWAG